MVEHPNTAMVLLVRAYAGQVHVGVPTQRGFTINPVSWLGGLASGAVNDVFKGAMLEIWSASLFLLRMAFSVIDALATPDLSSNGPLGDVLPITLSGGGAVAVLMFTVQIATALARRDGQSLGRIVMGVLQYGAVMAGYLGVAAGFMAAASGLEHALLHSMLNIDNLSGFNPSAHWPRQVGDATLAGVLGILGIVLVIPAAFFYLLIMLVREVAIVLLVATTPITAAGLVNETTKAWFWKSLRWYVSCLLIAPTAALVLGIGVRLSTGIVAGSGSSTAAVGQAVIGVLVIAVGAVAPMVLFRLLAFVEPHTASGAALRQSWSDAGGASGVLGGKSGGSAGTSTGSAAASKSGTDGRSGGESGAEDATQSRLSGAMGKLGGAAGGMLGAAGQITSVAHRAVDIASDVLGQAGVGSPGYTMTPTDERSQRQRRSNNSSGGNQGSSPTEQSDAGGGQSSPPSGGSTPGGGGDAAGGRGPSGGGGFTPAGPAVPDAGQLPLSEPGGPPGGGQLGGSTSPGGAGGAGGAGVAGGGSAAELAVVAL